LAENSVVYLDPPYLSQGRQLYNVHMEEKEYEIMADKLKEAEFEWVLSHDDHKKIIDLFKEYATINTISGVPYTINSIKDKRKTELIITKK
jgi:DNA adenine methylase